MTSRILLGSFLASSVLAGVFQSWPCVALATLVLAAYLAEVSILKARAYNFERLEKLSALAEGTAADSMLLNTRLAAVERKIEDPATGLSEQVRLLKNRTGFGK